MKMVGVEEQLGRYTRMSFRSPTAYTSVRFLVIFMYLTSYRLADDRPKAHRSAHNPFPDLCVPARPPAGQRC